MFHCDYSEESRNIDMVMRNFKLTPYPEVAARLDEATQYTISVLEK
ncbi:hypothetical protein MsAm2_08070 [Methanolapillus ohkumae]|uniref:Uncharacterized protein n=1 Tax=Methanolapillus ohkumae TaxID=3028298 RepID=A0AA97A657_9EURY|nr:hypothetical protein MsAm2_08070 [Methanosarcinaceae archaeon Am2]